MNTPEAAATQPYVALVLQGGGALGAYHVGAFEALAEAGYRPQWVAGVSIGAVNAALIAGNTPDNQVRVLDEFWRIITRPSFWDAMADSSEEVRRWYNTTSAMLALTFGQPHFSMPHLISPYLAAPGTPAATSVYNNSPLRETLARLVDFDIINRQQMRLSLGVTQVSSGDLVFFDNTDPDSLPIGPDHVIASSAIPPMFPGSHVKGELYWDGGIVDNTPLEPVLADQDEHPQRDTLVFMIDLWDGSGPEPKTIDEVMWRYNQIQFASRTDRHIKEIAEKHNLRRLLVQAAQFVPEEMRGVMPTIPDGTYYEYGNLDIVRVTYHPTADKTSLSYVDFSPLSIADRRRAGYHDMRAALEQKPWQTPASDEAAASLSFAMGRKAGAPPAARTAVHEVRAGHVHSSYPGLERHRP